MKVEKIFAVSDVLRGDKGLDYNTPWLYELVSVWAGAVCGVPVVKMGEAESERFQKEFFEILGVNLTKTAWIDAWSLEPTKELIEFMGSIFRNSFVIAFELHPLLQKCFDKLGLRYLKLMNHPVRYMDDIFFGMTSNVPEIREKLKAHRADEELFRQHAGLVKAEYAVRKFTRRCRPILPDSAVFFAQTNVDASLIENNVTHNLYDFMDKFLAATKNYAQVYYKIHPMGRDQELIDFIKKIPGVIVPRPDDYDAYEFMASENIKKCFSLSSGALYEARWFGKQTEYFFRQPVAFADGGDNAGIPEENVFVPVYRSYWKPSFWKDVLAPALEVRENVPDLPDENYANRMRRILNMNWGYRDYSSVIVNKTLERQAQERRAAADKKKAEGKAKLGFGFFPKK